MPIVLGTGYQFYVPSGYRATCVVEENSLLIYGLVLPKGGGGGSDSCESNGYAPG
jgi:hypothetical protein